MPKSNNKPSHTHGHSHMGMMILCVVLMGGAFLFLGNADNRRHAALDMG